MSHIAPLVDVLMLAYCKTRREYQLTSDSLATLLASAPDKTFRIVLVETASRETLEEWSHGKLFGPDVQVVFPHEPFQYNLFLQHGFARLTPPAAPRILISNNDVLFEPGFATALIEGLHSFESVSPWCPGFHDAQFDAGQAAHEGLRTSLELCGWAIMFRRSVLETIPFADLFPAEFSFWCQDNYYGFQLQRHGMRHALVPAARVHHLFCQSHGLIDPDRHEDFTVGSLDVLKSKTSPTTGNTADPQACELTIAIPARLDDAAGELVPLVRRLDQQTQDKPVEFLALLDNGGLSLAAKCQTLARWARGRRLCFLQADEEVADDFVNTQLDATRRDHQDVSLPSAAAANATPYRALAAEPRLTICVLTVPSRLDHCFARLTAKLCQQAQDKPVEILALLDNKRRTIGEKRNLLLQHARGQYVCFVDDDDELAEDYTEALLAAIASVPPPDCIVFDAWVTIDGQAGKRCRYGIELEDRDLPDEYQRLPNHLCCFRRQLAQAVRFDAVSWHEDFRWAAAIRPRIERQFRIPRVLYYYRYESAGSETGPGQPHAQTTPSSAPPVAHTAPLDSPAATSTDTPIASVPASELPIYGFLHVALMPGWRAIVADQLRKLHASGLCAKTRRIFVGLVGATREEFDLVDEKLEVVLHEPDVSVGELPTLEALRRFCQHTDAHVFYVHTKGVSRPSESTRDWRHLMEHFVIIRHEDCLRHLATHDACGVNWLAAPLPHYSGNFWWTKSSYVRTLPSLPDHADSCAKIELPDAFIPDWWSCEFWIGANPQARAACLHASGINHYLFRYPRVHYVSLRDVSLTASFHPLSAWQGLENAFQPLLEPIGPPRTIVEVGVGYGYSLFALAAAAPEATVFGIDPYDDLKEADRQRLADLDAQAVLSSQAAEAWVRAHLSEFPNARLIKDTSLRAASKFAQSIDVLHIDGIHTLDDVRRDFCAWEPLVRPGGCVLFHDTRSFPEDVGRFFDSLAGYKTEIVQGCGLGAWYKPPAAGPSPPTPRAADSPLLSACLIVRDAADTLQACLGSISPWVDELVVVDTGSLDDTVAIAERLGARVFHFPWCDDFSAARNESLRHARGKWLFWMDADDTISAADGQRLAELAATAPLTGGPVGYVLQVHCPNSASSSDGESATVVDHVKLIRNLPEIRFEGRIHEQLLGAIRRLGGEVAWTEIAVVHSGADHSPDGRQRKYARDLKLLQLELSEHPRHPFVWFNLGMTYADMGQYQQAVEALERSVELAQPGESQLRKAYALLVASYQQLGQLQRAWETCQRGLEACPGDTELAFRAGILHHHFGRYELAVQAYQDALAPTAQRYLSSLDRAIRGYKTRHNLALVRMDQGRFDLAEAQWRLVLEECPLHRPAWIGLAECLARQGKFSQALAEAAPMQQWPELRATACQVRAGLAQAQGDVEQTRRELENWRQLAEDDLELLRFRCQFLWQHGPRGETLAALSELRARAPDDVAAARNLAQLYEQLGCPRSAADNYAAALRLEPTSISTMIGLARCLEKLEDIQGAWAVLSALPADAEGVEAVREHKQACAHRLVARLLKSSETSAGADLHTIRSARSSQGMIHVAADEHAETSHVQPARAAHPSMR
jgi:glycosyltransferase involved in cell wall biosynthesis/tetratricopeptide (TPR) repeat protein